MDGITPPTNPDNLSLPYQLPTDKCPVCLESFAGSEVRVIKECMHMIHDECLMTWLSNNRTCPVCRTSLLARDIQPASAIGGNPDLPETGPGQNLNRDWINQISFLMIARGYPSRDRIEALLSLESLAIGSNPDPLENGLLNEQAIKS